jgi:hypothetical protein
MIMDAISGCLLGSAGSGMVRLCQFDQFALTFTPKRGITMAKVRSASILFEKKGSERAVRVLHPGKLTPDDMHRIDDVLVNKVIKGLTGCSCLSGVIDVLWERQFENVLDVQLGEAFKG